jgi:hypothetical protein
MFEEEADRDSRFLNVMMTSSLTAVSEGCERHQSEQLLQQQCQCAPSVFDLMQ